MSSITEHRFFAGMPADHINALERIVRPLSFAAGQTLFEQGEPATSAYFLVSGRIEVRATMPGGGQVLLSELGAGDVLGELSLIERHRRTANCVATQAGTALIIDRNDLSALCAHYHPASLELLHRLALLLAERIHASNKNAGHELNKTHRATPPAPQLDDEARGAPFDVRPFLPVLSFFGNFTPADIDAFLNLCRIWTLPRGRVAISPADNGRSCFVVVRGAAEALAHADGHSVRFGVLGPGSLFGELSWLLGVERSAEVRSRENCTLLELGAAQKAGLLDPDNHLSFRFHESLVRSLMLRLGAQTRALARTEQKRLAGVRLWGH